MSGRCRHENTGDLVYWLWVPDGQTQEGREMHVRTCYDCNDYLPLGHSDETPERVAIEIRAAEIAALRSDLDTGGWAHYLHRDGAEHAGWIEHAFDSQKVPEQSGEWAGWLAREIATHKETP